MKSKIKTRLLAVLAASAAISFGVLRFGNGGEIWDIMWGNDVRPQIILVEPRTMYQKIWGQDRSLKCPLGYKLDYAEKWCKKYK